MRTRLAKVEDKLDKLVNVVQELSSTITKERYLLEIWRDL